MTHNVLMGPLNPTHSLTGKCYCTVLYPGVLQKHLLKQDQHSDDVLVALAGLKQVC